MREALKYPTFQGGELEFDSSDYPQKAVEEGQLTMPLAESDYGWAKIENHGVGPRRRFQL
jgi:hypothetical protein